MNVILSTDARAICVLSTLLIFSGCTAERTADQVTGYVEHRSWFAVAPAAGRLDELAIRAGERVNTNDLLFRLDNVGEQAAVAEAEGRVGQSVAQLQNLSTGARDAEIRALQAQMREAEARFAEARSERNRLRPLVESGVASQAEGELAEHQYLSAQAAVAAAREQIAVAEQPARPAELDAATAARSAAEAALQSARYRQQQRSVHSPVNALVEATFYLPGEQLQAGAIVASLLPDNEQIVRFFVDQARLPQLQLGQTVNISADGLESPLEAYVSEVATRAVYTPPVLYSEQSRSSLVFRVEARLPADATLPAGLPVSVDW